MVLALNHLEEDRPDHVRREDLKQVSLRVTVDEDLLVRDVRVVLRPLDQLDAVLPGRVGGSDRPSQIRDLATGALLRL